MTDQGATNVKAPVVTVKTAVKVAAKTQQPTVVAAVLILLAYLIGMVVGDYNNVLREPPSREEILK